MSVVTHDAHPSLALLTIAREVELGVARVLEPHGLTLRKFSILQWTGGSAGVSATELARRLRSTPDDLRMLVRSMVDAGLLRSSTGGSGHEPLLAITPAGSALLAELDIRLRELDERSFATAELEDVAHAVVAATTEPDRAPED